MAMQVALANLPQQFCPLTGRQIIHPTVMRRDLSDWWPTCLHDMRDDRVVNMLIVEQQARDDHYEKLRNLNVVLGFSGGLDSTTVLHWCLRVFGSVHCLIFDYGQRHKVELEIAEKYLTNLAVKTGVDGKCNPNISWDNIDMSPINSLAESSLTRESIPTPRNQSVDEIDDGIPNTFVPGRNIYFVTALAQRAYRLGGRHIALGVNVLDYSVGADTVVFTQDRSGIVKSVKIKNLRDSWQGLRTASVNIRTNQVEWREIKGWFAHDVRINKKYRITLERGQTIDITDGHSIFTIDEQTTRLTEVKGSDVCVGMPIAVPFTACPDTPTPELEMVDIRGIISQSDARLTKSMFRLEQGYILFRNHRLPVDFPLTDDFLRIVGLWIAEGGKEIDSNNHTLAFSIGGVEKNARLFESYFGGQGYVVQRHQNGFDVSITSKLYAEVFRLLDLFGTSKRGEKKLPDFYWRLSQRQRRIVVAAIFDGDGHKCDRHSIDIAQKSHAVIDGLYQTFLLDGIFPSMKLIQHEQKMLSITCAEDMQKFVMHYPMWHYDKVMSYSIALQKAGKDKVRGFWKCDGVWSAVSKASLKPGLKTEAYCRGGKYDSSIRAQRAALFEVPTLAHLVDSQVAMLRVKSVEPIDDEVMYDLSVEGNQNFIANGVLAHNSGYPDCRPEFLDAMRNAIGIGIYNGTGADVGVHAPLMHLTKAQIIRLGRQLGVRYEDTHSCYNGVLGGCGECDSCLLRRQAFHSLGLEDPAVEKHHSE